MSVTVFVEGGGHGPNSGKLQANLRKGFRELLVSAGFSSRLPRVVACGPRHFAYDSFVNAPHKTGEYPLLLVDSESLVDNINQPTANPAGAWQHLLSRDGWARPASAASDQAQLMVTTMETWLVADRLTFVSHFPGINPRSLPPDTDLENRSKSDINSAIEAATLSSSKGVYDKGRDSFDLLGKVNPSVLKAKLPHFQRFIEALDAHA